MKGFGVCLLVLLLCSVASCGRHEQSERRQQRGRGERGYELEFGEPKEAFRSEGGSLRIWNERIDAFEKADIGMGELTLEEDGLLIPVYSDSDAIAYVLEGAGRFGVANPLQGEFKRQYVARIQKGDVFAIPKGVAFWVYNDGKERQRIVCVSDSSKGVSPGSRQVFGLAGAEDRRLGGVIHGFSRSVLADAWGVDEETVKTLLESQKQSYIIRARERIRFPEETYHQHNRLNYDAEFKHSLARDEPDLVVENGGWLKTLTSAKFPVLKRVDFGAYRVRLEQNAACAPAWFRNAHQILYVIRGSGRVQVVSNEGERILDTDVKQGSVIAIPQFFPAIKIAGDEGMDFIDFVTSDRASPSFLAGGNSVYRGIPDKVVEAAFNVEEETLRKVRKGRSDREAVILAPPRSSSESGERRRRRKEEEKMVVSKVERWVDENLEAAENLFGDATDFLKTVV